MPRDWLHQPFGLIINSEVILQIWFCILGWGHFCLYLTADSIEVDRKEEDVGARKREDDGQQRPLDRIIPKIYLLIYS